ncbi:periplasmic heavy metal sensor [Sphingomonas crusticola]|uniref:periplasmic heavy metal sensor n=1 Tax=Sphingomonas crusticola TaxID=1697973 RepID=UPI000E24101A|nr:periplasmic heavy metal sensor [Sphingomonas crusticola]
MTRILSLALLLVAGAAEAAPTAAAPAAPATTSAPAPKRFPGVSDAGNAILAKAQTAPDPQFQALGKQVRAAHDQLMSAVMAPVIDVDKVTAALRQEEAAQAQMRTYNNDRMLRAVKQLPEDDRGTFLRTLILSRRSSNPAPAPQP